VEVRWAAAAGKEVMPAAEEVEGWPVGPVAVGLHVVQEVAEVTVELEVAEGPVGPAGVVERGQPEVVVEEEVQEVDMVGTQEANKGPGMEDGQAGIQLWGQLP